MTTGTAFTVPSIENLSALSNQSESRIQHCCDIMKKNIVIQIMKSD